MNDGTVIYAIGDIHGRGDLLDALLAMIVADAQSLPRSLRLRLVFLGDYIDRGPRSKAVVERLMRLSAVEGVVCLRGNHEQVLLDFLDDPRVGPDWATFGAEATLRSYGVAAPSDGRNAAAWRATRDALAAALPATHLAWLHALPTHFDAGEHHFVHAGVRPGRALADQSDADRLWIREPFLSWSGPFERVIVHGHSPQAEPQLGRWRIGVDTGAYATGRLTAVRLMGADRQILQTSPSSGQEKGPPFA